MTWTMQNPKTGEEFEIEENYDPKTQIDTNREIAIAKGYVPIINIANPKTGEVHTIDDRNLEEAIKKGYETHENYQNRQNVLSNRAAKQENPTIHGMTKTTEDMASAAHDVTPFMEWATKKDIHNQAHGNKNLEEDLLMLREADKDARLKRSPTATAIGTGVGVFQTPGLMGGKLAEAGINSAFNAADAYSRGENPLVAAGTTAAVEAIPGLYNFSKPLQKWVVSEGKEVASKLASIPGISHLLNLKGHGLVKALIGQLPKEAEKELPADLDKLLGKKDLSPGKLLQSKAAAENAAIRTKEHFKLPEDNSGFKLPGR